MSKQIQDSFLKEEIISREELKECLHNSRLLHILSPEQMNELLIAQIGRLCRYARGEILVSEGEDISNLSIILRGKVTMERLFLDGSRSLVDVLHEKDLMGIEGLGNTRFSSYYYYVAQSDVITFEIPCRFFRTLSEKNPDMQVLLLNQVLGVLAHDNSRYREKLDVLSAANLRTRIQTFLYYQEKRFGSRDFSIAYTREEMASYLCVNRSALSRELSRMQDEGLLEMNGNHFRLPEWQ